MRIGKKGSRKIEIPGEVQKKKKKRETQNRDTRRAQEKSRFGMDELAVFGAGVSGVSPKRSTGR